MKKVMSANIRAVTRKVVPAECVCGAVKIEIDFPARCAWHDHSAAARQAHGAAYATYVASWRSRFRVTDGKTKIRCFKDKTTGARRSFCSRCGTPIIYERDRSPHMVNIPRALFKTPTGREARYHMGIEDMPEWAYLGQPLVALSGFPSVVWDRSKRKRPPPFGAG
jgi:hypothetical protein